MKRYCFYNVFLSLCITFVNREYMVCKVLKIKYAFMFFFYPGTKIREWRTNVVNCVFVSSETLKV